MPLQIANVILNLKYMNDYRFILDRKSKKFTCPECSKRTFTRYFDITTGEYLPDHYGRCDREIKCTYHLNPYKDGYSKMIWEQENEQGANFQSKQLTLYRPQPKQGIKAPSFIPYEILAATRKGYEQNTFIQNLLHRLKFPFNENDIKQVIGLYHLGTVCKGYRSGAITFPFIDYKGHIRAIQAKQFDISNHTVSTDFLHSIYQRACEENNKPLPDWLKSYLLNDTKVSCSFGEHLLSKYPANPIAFVEAPKTAIIGTLYFGMPDNPENFLWLAVYNVSSLTIEKCKALKGRKVVLVPDLSKTGKTFKDWGDKAKQFQKDMPGTTFKVSDLIESLATDECKNDGEDIADFLTRMNWKEFRKRKSKLPEPIKEKPNFSELLGTDFEPETKTFGLPELPKLSEAQKKDNEQTQEHFVKCEDWRQELIELEKYFKTVSLPAITQLNKAAKITNVPLFIDTHFQTLNRYKGNKTFLPYLTRLKELKQLLTTNQYLQ